MCDADNFLLGEKKIGKYLSAMWNQFKMKTYWVLLVIDSVERYLPRKKTLLIPSPLPDFEKFPNFANSLWNCDIYLEKCFCLFLLIFLMSGYGLVKLV